MAATRTNIVTNAAAKDAFIAGVELLKTEATGLTTDDLGILPRPGVGAQPISTYDLFVIWHVMAMDEMTPAGNTSGRNAAHMGPAFLPWHRWMLMLLEMQFQRVLNDADFGLPYWDWAADGELPISDQPKQPIWSADIAGGDGRSSDSEVFTGPFRRTGYFRVVVEVDSARQMRATNRPLRRSFGHRATDMFGNPAPFGLPTKSQMAAALSETNFDESPYTASVQGMRNLLEGWREVDGKGAPNLHNLVHVWIGGDMSPGTSPNDPAFFLNHCNVDRAWAKWQADNPTRPYLPPESESASLFRHRRNDPLHSVLTDTQPTPAQMLDVSATYDYDSLSVA